MKQIILVVVALMLATLNAEANQYIRYCYNCSDKKTVIKKYYNNPVVVAPTAAVPIIPMAPAGIVVGAQIVYPAIPVMNCAWYPDPYTFLGEIFGYDYIQICQ